MSRRTLVQRAVLLGLVGFLAGTGSADGQTVIFVDAAATGAGDGGSWADAFTAVQPGLNAAQSGDQVWVAAGTYAGTITLKLDVALYGGFAGTEDPATFDLADRDFAAQETILDGNQAGSVVTAPSGATATTRIDGFRITNGSGTTIGTCQCGGGIYCNESSPAIENNTINDNDVRWHQYGCGGGIYCALSSPTIAGNTIADNRADSGGGICCTQSSSPAITNNAIASNIAGEGGGIYCNTSAPEIVDNTIASNRAGFAGGLYLYGSAPVVRGNSIRDNSASAGGGLYLDESAPTITSNTISGNIAISSVYDADGGGGGLYLVSSAPVIANNAIAGNFASAGGGLCVSDSIPALINNTIAGNYAATSGGGVHLHNSFPTIANSIVTHNSSGIFLSGTGSTATLRHNCIYGNAAYDYSGIADPTGAEGNIAADPHLANLDYGDVHIQPDSPCLDAGDNTLVQGAYDMDGQARIQPVGGTVDIGADESDGTVWWAGPYVIVRVSPDGDDENDGSTWTLAKRTVQAGIDAASIQGGEVWVAAGTYYERITLAGRVYVYGGFGGTETARAERNWNEHLTVLDGQQQGSVVSAGANCRLNAVDGFTITGGWAQEGGGVRVEYAALTIANNTITGNGSVGIYSSRSCPMIVNNAIASHDVSGCGLYLTSSCATITNNTIADNARGGIYMDLTAGLVAGNRIEGNSADVGAGLMLEHSSVSITGNLVANNRAVIMGGGLSVWNCGSDTAITGNVISGNSAVSTSDWSYGGGLGMAGATATVANNIVLGNSASGCGGGLSVMHGDAVIANNTIAGNNAREGGGLWINGASPLVANNIAAFNSSGIRRGPSTYGMAVLRHNCVYGNTGSNIAGVLFPTGPGGNISVDPHLAGWAFGNAHVQPGSPCINAGSNGLVQGVTDMDGQPRVLPEGSTVDIGADESDGTAWPPGPYRVVRVGPDGHDDQDGSTWSAAKRTVQAGIDAAAVAGGEVWVQTGSYGERVTLPPFTHVYGGFAGHETTRSTRDWRTNVTVLDGQQEGSVVTVPAGHRVNTIDGFVITNGRAVDGGGLWMSASPIVANDRICGNAAVESGGGLYAIGSTVLIANSAIVGNDAAADGGGLCVASNAKSMILGSTIANNTAGTEGGGVCIYGAETAVLANTIIAFNSSGAYLPRGVYYDTQMTLRHNCAFGNTAYDYAAVSDPTGTYGNISADPLFRQMPTAGPDGVWGTADDDYGDLRLLGGSPCIDAADNARVPADTMDLDGDGNVAEPVPFDLAGRPRFIDDPFSDDTGSGTVPIVDMGAYEYQVPGDLDGDSDVDGSDYALLLAAFGSCAGGANYLPAADADEDGCVTLVDYQLWLQGYRDFIGDPLAPPPPLPDWEPDPDPRPVPRPPPRPTAGNGGAVGEGELAPVSPTD